jgi:hypothetical protein
MANDRKLGTRIALATLASFLAAAGGAQETYDRVVHPTGNFPEDVQNVQAAVDLGGTVLLKARNTAGEPTAFNFGSFEGTVCDRQVGLHRDVWLLGETAGSSRTTITGGYRPLLIGVPSGGWCTAGFAETPPQVRVEGITFDRSLQAAIDVYKASRAEIVGNRITNIDVSFVLGVGVNVFGGGAQRRITGKVTIANNLIEFATPGTGWNHGIVLDNVSADVAIERNWIRTTQDFTGILVVRQVEAKVRIADNVVMSHPDGLRPEEPGIGIYIFANDLWDAIRNSAPVYEVVGNRVVTDGAVGIGLVGLRGSIEGPVIERNHISLVLPPEGSFLTVAAGIALGGNVSGARIAANRIDGPADFALDVFALDASIFGPNQSAAVDNAFLGNNLTQFRPELADVFLDEHTRNTAVAGRVRSVIDLGQDNRITGAGTFADGAPFGQRIRRVPWVPSP